MITFKRFLNENETIITFNEVEDIGIEVFMDRVIDYIKKDCQPWIKELGNLTPLYRGFTSFSSLFQKRTVRTDRKPRDSTKELHKKLDEYFDNNFGIKFRSEAVFASTSYNNAKVYGDVGLIFPIAHYHYIFSNHISDLTEEINRYIKWNHSHSLNSSLSGDIIKNMSKDDFDEMIDKLEYQMDFGLKEVLDRNIEVMIKCDQYYSLLLKQFSHKEREYIFDRLETA